MTSERGEAGGVGGKSGRTQGVAEGHQGREGLLLHHAAGIVQGVQDVGQRRARVAADLRLAVLRELGQGEGCLAPDIGLCILQPLTNDLHAGACQLDERLWQSVLQVFMSMT